MIKLPIELLLVIAILVTVLVVCTIECIRNEKVIERQEDEIKRLRRLLSNTDQYDLYSDR